MEVDRAAARNRYDRALRRAGAFLRGRQRRDGSTSGAGSIWGYYSQPLALLSGGSPDDWSCANRCLDFVRRAFLTAGSTVSVQPLPYVGDLYVYPYLICGAAIWGRSDLAVPLTGTLVRFQDPCGGIRYRTGAPDLIDPAVTAHGGIALLATGHLQSMNGSGAAELVRTPPDQPSLAGRVLDCGADGVVFPLIGDRSQAQAAVAACKYPPLGGRGMGPRRASGYGRFEADYLRSANDRTVVAIQIETGDAVERIDQILSVPGVDVALLGLGDLSASLGCHLDFAAPPVVAAVETVLEACGRHDVLPGMAYAHDAATARAYVDQGFRLVGVGSDDAFLMDGSRRALDGLGSLR